MGTQFSEEDLYSAKSYNIGEDVVMVEHQAIYIGSSQYDDTDWLNIARVYVNGTAVFDHRDFNYGPQRISDEKAIQGALAYPDDIHAKHSVEKYEEYEKEIKDMSVLGRFFNRKEYHKLTYRLKKVERDYLYVKGILDNSSILRKAAAVADKVPSDIKKPVVQPGSY